MIRGQRPIPMGGCSPSKGCRESSAERAALPGLRLGPFAAADYDLWPGACPFAAPAEGGVPAFSKSTPLEGFATLRGVGARIERYFGHTSGVRHTLGAQASGNRRKRLLGGASEGPFSLKRFQ